MNKMTITRTCPITKKTNTFDLDVTLEQIADWQSGTLIQNAMPNLSADEREFVKTGISAEGWLKLWGK